MSKPLVHLRSPTWDPKGTFMAARCNELVVYCTNVPGVATCPTCIDDFNAEVASKHLGRPAGPTTGRG